MGPWGHNDRTKAVESRGKTCPYQRDKGEGPGRGNLQEIRRRSINVLYLEGNIRHKWSGWTRSRTKKADPSIRKLRKEKERLKKMLAEKELEVSLLQEAH